jgi:hypothetical protein
VGAFTSTYDSFVREHLLTAADMLIFNVIVGELIMHMTKEERLKFENAVEHQREAYLLRN